MRAWSAEILLARSVRAAESASMVREGTSARTAKAAEFASMVGRGTSGKECDGGGIRK